MFPRIIKTATNNTNFDLEMNTTSSLQRALKPAPSDLEIPSSSGFEACFQQGLDLSEFGNPKAAAGGNHSLELLKLKQKEAEQKAVNEQEESRLADILKQRLSSLRKSAEQSSLVSSLVEMHQGDRQVIEARNLRSKSRGNSKSSRVISKGTSEVRKGKVTKKIHRRKH